VAELSEFEQLLFTWMIPHADDWGIMTGTPLGIRMKIVPGTNRSLEEIDQALTHIEEAGLIWRYEADGHGPLVQFRKWAGYQPVRSDRRAVPQHPGYDGEMTTTGSHDDNHTSTNGSQDDNQRLSNDGLQDITQQDRTQQDRQDTTTTLHGPDVAAPSAPAFKSNLQSLSDLGIHEPKRSMLAGLPWVNEGYLEVWVSYIGDQAARGNILGQGFLIKQIEARASPWTERGTA
jgi:hypothetical protein